MAIDMGLTTQLSEPMIERLLDIAGLHISRGCHREPVSTQALERRGLIRYISGNHGFRWSLTDAGWAEVDSLRLQGVIPRDDNRASMIEAVVDAIAKEHLRGGEGGPISKWVRLLRRGPNEICACIGTGNSWGRVLGTSEEEYLYGWKKLLSCNSRSFVLMQIYNDITRGAST